MKKRLIIAFSILLVFVFIAIWIGFEAGIINPARVKPIELQSDYKTAKKIAEEIFSEELKDTEYTVLNAKPIIHIVTDCPKNSWGMVTFPHGHQWCKRYYRVADMAKANIKKDGELINIYCYLDSSKEKIENKIVTDAYFDDIHNGFENYFSEEVAKIFLHEYVEITYFWGHDSWNGDDNLFPYQLDSFDKVLADPTTQFSMIVEVHLPGDAVIDREKCQKLMDLVPHYKNHEIEYRLWQNGRYHVIKRDKNTGELIAKF